MDAAKTVGIISKPGSDQGPRIVPELLGWLKTRDIAVRYDEQTAQYAALDGAYPRDQVPDGTQLVIVLGGDGTLLSAARAIGGREIPLFAVNLGGLGFLTSITIDELYPELERVIEGNRRVGARKMLHCELMRKDTTVARFDALNDIVITKASLARMIDLEAHIDGHFVCSYKADGLIVATPTGSTAYSLSAGGPIVFPTVGALCITPICPHMLTNRPVIVPGSSVIQLINLADDDNGFLTIDGQVGGPLKHSDTVVCSMSEKSVYLIRPPKMLFFDVLREKLSWGER